jgi:hypothetical protein
MTNDKKIVSHYNDPKKATSGKPVDQSKLFTSYICIQAISTCNFLLNHLLELQCKNFNSIKSEQQFFQKDF